MIDQLAGQYKAVCAAAGVPAAAALHLDSGQIGPSGSASLSSAIYGDLTGESQGAGPPWDEGADDGTRG
jgi:hypothetical protein